MVIGGRHFGQYTYDHWYDHEYDQKQEMDIIMRLEEEKDYAAVEHITREAFWNVHCPGCDEHLLIHTMRSANEFIKELDYVAVYNNNVVGHIAYAKTKIFGVDAEYDVITFGPVSVQPSFQNRSIGKKLIEHTIKKAAEMGFNAILIYGFPKYYNRFGFVNCKEFNITDAKGNFHDALMALELYPKALENISGKFHEGDIYKVDKQELELFEKNFPYKEKLVLETQIFKE